MNPFLKKIGEFVLGKVFSGPLEGFDNVDVALRYLPIAEDIRKGPIKDPSILEAGSGAKGITPYLPNPVTGADIRFDGKVAKTLRPVYLTGPDLPFPDRSHDYVVSADMLEHVPVDQRPRIMAEMIRVARHRVFLAVPCGESAERQDKRLDDLYFRTRGSRYHFLKDHIDNGLPKKEEIASWIETASAGLGRGVRVRTRDNVNLRIRDLYMRAWIVPGCFVFFLLLSPVLCGLRRFLNFGTCYRQLFVIDIEPPKPQAKTGAQA